MVKSSYNRSKEYIEFQLWERCRDLTEEELVALLDDSNAMLRLEAARNLQLKGGNKIIKLAQQDCISQNYKRRALGAFILGQVNLSPTEEKKTVDILYNLSLEDKSAKVRSNAVSSLGHRCIKNKNYAPLLLNLCQQTVLDPSSSVRESIAFALSTFYHQVSIPLLIKLLNDSHSNVKDWAAFAVNMNAYNTAELRDCFFSLLNDSDSDVQYEAIIGLAKMQDKRVTKTLINKLSKDEIYDEFVKAAGYLGDVALLPTLKKIRDKFDSFDELSSSISILEQISSNETL